jgi:hypothetical protein
MNSSGTRTSIFMIGSSSVTLFSAAWRNASTPRRLERHFARVDVVVLAVVQRRADVDEREAECGRRP